ncbi:helix-turn-helix domain-containing protein [Raineyella sp. W15-4]|uniref:TetR/AcrR family transcriptional regulator n=1 Tax=Raineyella sp. W15-4 TaxID=3081651 RepID=UPI002955D1E5|nr:helix-turn-helix domain-containing protein [Raineyella sp. W15-4]WOQ18612.1 helix-turn-helix domain-containing protein [Raineyella sp. W15-4]
MHSSSAVPWPALAALWGVAGDAPGPKPRYSVAEVARAGVRVADEHGLSGVTLQVVGRELGLTTTALYRYVDSKETLLELMADVALGAAPHLTGSLADRVHTWCTARWQVLQGHRWLSEVPIRTTPRGPDGTAWQESLVSGLVEAGVGDPVGVARLLAILVHGHAATGGTEADAPTNPPTWWTATVERTAPTTTELVRRRTNLPEDDLAAAVERLIASLVIESAYGLRPPIGR